MVTHYESGLAKFYLRFYPIAALVILAFEAWALIIQLNNSGLEFTEYSFGLICVLAVTSAILLLVMKAKSHASIVAITYVLAVFAVLPIVGYHALPVSNQVTRLENLLVKQGILRGNQLIPVTSEPERSVRESITDAVTYLAYEEDAKLPSWFYKQLGETDVFKTKLGFEQTWPEYDNIDGGGSWEYLGTSLYLKPVATDISGYSWAVNMQNFEGKEQQCTVSVEGDRGSYQISWAVNTLTGIPALTIELDGNVILHKDMNDYIDEITAKFPPGHAEPYQAAMDDMSLQLETEELDILLVFNNIDIYVDTRQDTINYWFNLSALYMKEKP